MFGVDIRLIGIIEDRNKRMAGCRLLDLGSRGIKDVSISSLTEALKTASVKVVGLELEGNRLVGTNGRLKRYPVIVDRVVRGRSPLIILSQYIDGDSTVGFRVCDWKGKIVDATVDFVIKYAELQGIANGAIKELGDRKIVSSICGEYNKINITNSKVKRLGKQQKEHRSGRLIGIIASLGDHIPNESKYEMMSEQKIGVCTGDINIAILGLTDDKREVSLMHSEDKSILNGVEVLIIPPSTKVIDNGIVDALPNLKKIIIQEGVESLEGEGGNEKNHSITEIIFPSTLKIMERLFGDLVGIEELDMSHTKIEEIRPESFGYCSNLKNVRFPNSLKCINWASFENCPIQKFTITENFESLREWTFSTDTVVEFEEGMRVVKDRILYGYEFDIPPEECEDGFSMRVTHCKNIILPDSIEIIGKQSFYFNKMEDLRVPIGIKQICDEAFMGCRRMKTIDFKECKELVEIGDRAFAYCKQLKSVDLRDCVKLSKLSESAFDNCYELKDLKLNDNLKHLESRILERIKNSRSKASK